MAGFSPGLDLLSRKVHGAGGNRTMNIIIQDVFIGGYVPGDSVLHRLDPRNKVDRFGCAAHRRICDAYRWRPADNFLRRADSYLPV